MASETGTRADAAGLCLCEGVVFFHVVPLVSIFFPTLLSSFFRLLSFCPACSSNDHKVTKQKIADTAYDSPN